MCSLKEGLIVTGILLGYLMSYLFVDQVGNCGNKSPLLNDAAFSNLAEQSQVPMDLFFELCCGPRQATLQS